MEIPRRRLVAIVLAVVAVTGALYAASWNGSWRRGPGRVPVETFLLEVDRFGLSPAFYWLPEPDRLVLVPAALVPWDGEPDEAGQGGEVLVVELADGSAGWRPGPEVFDPRARHVFWSLPQRLEDRPGGEVLHAGRSGPGPSATLGFSGFGISIPTYNANFPPFGEPGWRLDRRRFGRWRLTAGGAGSGDPELELTRLVLNSSQDVELSSLATWLPGGRFLVLTPKSGKPRLLLAGPFPSASPDRADQ